MAPQTASEFSKFWKMLWSAAVGLDRRRVRIGRRNSEQVGHLVCPVVSFVGYAPQGLMTGLSYMSRWGGGRSPLLLVVGPDHPLAS